MPFASDRVLEFERDEEDDLIALLFVTTIFGVSVFEDLLVIPDNGSAIAHIDHHHTVDVEYVDEQTLSAAIALMDAAGYSLPTELPDETFKPRDWME